ncbi:MAG: DUF503 domain-containing protein [Planctomycetota bacterium]|jgi:uncharacterized protein YlxP (DUF503 family)
MATIVGLVHLELNIVQAASIKDKRRAVKSFKDRMAHTHNVSIAEVDGLDDRRRAVLAAAIVGNDRRYVEGVLQRIVNAAGSHRDMILTGHEIQWL